MPRLNLFCLVKADFCKAGREKQRSNTSLWFVSRYILGSLLWKCFFLYGKFLSLKVENLFQKLLKSTWDNQHLSFVANTRILLRFTAFTMISSLQCAAALGLSARSEPCPVSLSKWTWHVNVWTWYLCVHHSNRAEILLTPEILSDRFWSDTISLHNFSGAVLCILLYFAVWDGSVGRVRHCYTTAVHAP